MDSNTHNLIFCAIKNGNPEGVSVLREKGVLVGENLGLFLLDTIEKNDLVTLKMLIDHGLTYKGTIDFKILLQAVINQGNPLMIKEILPHCGFSKPSELYIPKKLVIETYAQYKDCVKLLLKWNFTVDPESHHDEEFVFKTVEKGYVPIFLELLRLGVDINMTNSRTGINLLLIACLKKHYEIINILLQRKADLSKKVFCGYVLKHSLRVRDNSYIYNKLFKLSSHRSLSYMTCLHIAIFNDDILMINMLLNHDITTNIDSVGLFRLTCYAVHNNREQIVRTLLNRGVTAADINPNGKTFLNLSLKNDLQPHHNDLRYNIVKILLEKGATPNLQIPRNRFVFDAVKNGHYKIAKLFLDNRADIQYVNSRRETLFHKVVENDFDIAFIKILLKRDVQVNVKNYKGLTPLMIACKKQSKNQLDIVRILLNFNDDINCTDNESKSLIHMACNDQNPDLVSILLERGANPNVVDRENETPLHYACYHNSVASQKVIQLLLDHGAKIDAVKPSGWTPLFKACNNSNGAAVECLLANGANPNAVDKKGRTPLHIICKHKDITVVSIVKLLVDHGANINAVDARGWTPLFVACQESNNQVVEYLLINNANCNATDDLGQTLFHITAKQIRKYPYDEELHNRLIMSKMQLLLEYNANINSANKEGRTPLMIACQFANDTIIQYFLRHNANPNAVDHWGRTPLHFVCHRKDKMAKRIIELFLKYDANIDIADVKGWTPLFVACKSSSSEVVQCLLDNHANPHRVDIENSSLLHIAPKNCRGIVYQLLNHKVNVHSINKYKKSIIHCIVEANDEILMNNFMSMDININSVDNEGNTPLHIAVKKISESMTRTLLHHGANVNILNNNNKTPLQMALDILHQMNEPSANDDHNNRIGNVVDILKVQVIKLKVAGLIVHNQNLNVIYDSHNGKLNLKKRSNDNDMDTYEELLERKFERELAMMKKTNINIDNLTFYDLLTKHIRLLSQYVENKNLQEILTSKNHESEFPFYMQVIKDRIKKAMIQSEKNYLMYYTRDYFKLNRSQRLPDECIEMVLNYLNIGELRNFVEILKPLTSSSPSGPL
ncbi:ankyrin-1-like [Chelonus insularis]|uniref:ankyrin-1-like n=1 Tax=Chelonus insularis TaxID=460826 RepID=UPI00158E6D59|nr:ankyrin-1-like [Chelonus insularis]